MKRRIVIIIAIAASACITLIWMMKRNASTLSSVTTLTNGETPLTITTPAPQALVITPPNENLKRKHSDSESPSSSVIKKRIRDDFYKSNNYRDFLNNKAYGDQIYSEYYSNAALLWCKTLELDFLPKSKDGSTIFERGAVEQYIRDAESRGKTFDLVRRATNVYDKCEELFHDPRYTSVSVDELLNAVLTSNHPEAYAMRARELIDEKKDLTQAYQLLKEALFSDEGSAIFVAGTTLLDQHPIEGESYDLLSWAWMLASCDFANNCSEDSEMVLMMCASRLCHLNTDVRQALEYQLSSQDFTRVLAISERIKQEIRDRNFQALSDGEYATSH